MNDLISRQQAIDALNAEIMKRRLEDDINDGMLDEFDTESIIRQLPPIQPTNLQKLADEIASFKRCVKSENSDYLTGYLCALSVVEGMIADMREVTI